MVAVAVAVARVDTGTGACAVMSRCVIGFSLEAEAGWGLASWSLLGRFGSGRGGSLLVALVDDIVAEIGEWPA